MQRLWALLNTAELCIIEDHDNFRQAHNRARMLSERRRTIAVGVWSHDDIEPRWDNPSKRDGWITVYERGKRKTTLFTSWMRRCDERRDEYLKQ